MNVILLHNTHRNVSATHKAIFRVVRTILQKWLYPCSHHPANGFMCSRNTSVCTTLCNTITFLHASALVGL